MKNMMKTKKAICAGFMAALATGTGYAATVTGVTIEDFSSERGGFGSVADNTINGSGFNSTTGTHTADAGVAWQSNKIGANFDPTPVITFDLEGVYTIDSFSVWNFNQTPNSGIQNVTITYGLTTALGTTLSEVTTFSQASGLDTYTGETFSSFTPFAARYIRFDATSNYGDADRAGLAEVRFNAVPEPSFTLLGALGLGLLTVRRRR